MIQTAQCPKCRATNSSSAFQCIECGAHLTWAEPSQPTQVSPPAPHAVPVSPTSSQPITTIKNKPAPGNPEVNLTQAAAVLGAILISAVGLTFFMNRSESGSDIFVGSFSEGQNSLRPATVRLAEEVARNPGKTNFSVRWNYQGKVTLYPEIIYDKSAGTLVHKLTAGANAPAWRYTGVTPDALQKVSAAGESISDLDNYGATETFTK